MNVSPAGTSGDAALKVNAAFSLAVHALNARSTVPNGLAKASRLKSFNQAKGPPEPVHGRLCQMARWLLSCSLLSRDQP
jgi:hypothetical protein